MISVNEPIIDFKNNFKKNNNLGKLLNDIGNPQNKIRVINIVGTNGKGTVSNILSQGLQKKFKSVGLFTSPAFLYHNERFKINDKFISDDKLKKYLKNNEELFKKYELTFFEIFTFVCIKYFLDNKVDIAVIEAGIGGKSDSTSVFGNQECVGVTSISLDHQEIIGSTIKKIINEKIDIVKGENKIFISSDNIKYKKYITKKYTNTFFTKSVNTNILYNKGNIGLAFSILDEYKISMDMKEIIYPIGRFTYIKKAPDIIIDGCHNKDGILQSIKSLNDNNFIVLFSSSKKQNFKYLKIFKKEKYKYYFCEFDHFKSWKLSKKQKKDKHYISDWKSFIIKNKNENLYICGSLYFVPEVYNYYVNQKSGG